MIPEFQLIDYLKKRIPRSFQGEIGIGDDADITSLGATSIVVTTDAMVDGIDFSFDQIRAQDLGHKLLAINLSDLAAMGAIPKAYVLTLAMPKNLKVAWVRKFYEGLMKPTRHYRLKCLGGDLSAARELSVSLTLFGVPGKHPLVQRKHAKPGDLIAVTGKLGGSILGHHLKFKPRVEESLFLSGKFPIHSMIDISDGFYQDLEHLLKSSKVSADVWLNQLPISSAAVRLSRKTKQAPLTHALTDGEDFELLLTVSKKYQKKIETAWKKRFPNVSLSWVGEIKPHWGPIRWYNQDRKVSLKLKKKGYSHFS